MMGLGAVANYIKNTRETSPFVRKTQLNKMNSVFFHSSKKSEIE